MCGMAVATVLKNWYIYYKILFACCFHSTSIKNPPLRSFLTDLGVPIKAESCFSIMKGLSSVSDLELIY
jgi:hypothetical protein